MQVKFDKFSSEWSNNPEANVMLIRHCSNYWNDVLRCRGYVMLAEVLFTLGIKINITKHLDRSLREFMWLYDDGDMIEFGMCQQDDGSMLLTINID